MDQLKARKILHLEEQLEILEDKLNDFKKAYVCAEGAKAQFSIKRQIQDEINPEISRINEQYSHLIKGDDVNETDAEQIMEVLVKVTNDMRSHLPDELLQKLSIISQETQAQNKSATAKLKVILPIIPLLVNYELTLDTENILNEMWRKIRGLLREKADIVNP